MKQMNANLFHFFMKQYHCDHASTQGNDLLQSTRIVPTVVSNRIRDKP